MSNKQAIEIIDSMIFDIKEYAEDNKLPETSIYYNDLLLLKEVINRLQSLPDTDDEWISGTPPDDEEYIVGTSTGTVTSLVWCTDTGWEFPYNNWEGLCGKITHYQNFPTPPITK